jgi:hypothetical protein
MVRTITKLAIVPVALAVAACARSKDSSDLNGDMKRDLALASAPSLELASAATQHSRTDVVSAIEMPELAKKKPVAVHRPSPKREVVATPKPAPQVAEAPAPDPAPEPAPEHVAVQPSEPMGEPTVLPKPERAPLPGPGSNVDGVSIGDVIGVILRGGIGDDDHCDPRHRRPRGGMGGIATIPIGGGRINVPVGPGSFPRW